ncbi:MFS transporter [Massilia antarctica]|uniref:MFS transporter n=1 Tax=Massilia antarctica TaxID=2765360 RepID=UPI0006BB6206|nr:MFS transporter [Massilia sp. H27-R4]MCY0911554.1 MFS transporter [Massilia sp. H27-R4]CUI04830.1 Predicted beta-glucoside transporter, GPH family [Janthinobacterium sp. CG23_2]CUU28616.1 Predicted beta-glucoside transporter, GPH family [Janthinobacterium sp. CG23_2]
MNMLAKNSQQLSTVEKVGFGTGDMALNVVISSMMLLITFFYTDIYGLRTEHLALLFVVVKIIGGAADLAMGQVTDRFTSRMGRYRPWLLWLCVPYGVSVFFVFTTPAWGYDAKLVWAYGTYILMTLMTAGVGIPYISLISGLTSDPQERLSANGYRLFFAKIGAFMVTIIVPLLAEEWGKGSPAAGYQAAMALMAVMGVALFLFCVFTTTERVIHLVERQSLAEQFKLLMRNDQWLILCGVCVTGTVGYVVRGSVAIYYATYYLGLGPKMVSAFLSTGVAAAILSMIASTWITKSYCKVKLFRYTQLGVALISVLMYLAIKPGDAVLAFILYFMLSFVVDLHAPVFWSAIAETIDYGQVKTGKRVSGFAFGGISVCQKAGMAVAGGMVGLLLTYFQYVPNQAQTPLALSGIALMLTVIPGFFHFLMGALMFKYRITDNYYTDVKSDMRKLGFTTT